MSKEVNPCPKKLYDISTNKVKRGLCGVKYCRNERQPNRSTCSKHKRQREKLKNPIYYTWANLKGNAKRRGKNFGITLAQFKQFCKESGYMETKGRTWKDQSINRIDPDKGYTLDNIEVISHSLNSSRQTDKAFRNNKSESEDPLPY